MTQLRLVTTQPDEVVLRPTRGTDPFMPVALLALRQFAQDFADTLHQRPELAELGFSRPRRNGLSVEDGKHARGHDPAPDSQASGAEAAAAPVSAGPGPGSSRATAAGSSSSSSSSSPGTVSAASQSAPEAAQPEVRLRPAHAESIQP